MFDKCDWCGKHGELILFRQADGSPYWVHKKCKDEILDEINRGNPNWEKRLNK